ncbi:MAG: replication protein B [Plesiomonas shigelloides]
MTALTMHHLNMQPPGLRQIIGKYMASDRWTDTCNFFDSLGLFDKVTLCAHAGVAERYAAMAFECIPTSERENIVNAIDELRHAFASYRKHEVSNTKFLSWMTVQQRKTLYVYAGLSDVESMQPYCLIDNPNWPGSEPLINAIRDLCKLFGSAPQVLTAIEPSAYSK